MRFRIPDKDRSISINENSVWPGELAFQRIGSRTIATVPCAGDQMDCALAHIDPSDSVVFSIGDKNITADCNTDSLRSRKLRIFCRTAIAAEPFYSRACDVANHACREVELEDRIAFSQGDQEISGLVEIERTRTT